MIYRMVVITECIPSNVDGDALKPCHKTEPVLVIISESNLTWQGFSVHLVIRSAR